MFVESTIFEEAGSCRQSLINRHNSCLTDTFTSSSIEAKGCVLYEWLHLDIACEAGLRRCRPLRGSCQKKPITCPTMLSPALSPLSFASTNGHIFAQDNCQLLDLASPPFAVAPPTLHGAVDPLQDLSSFDIQASFRAPKLRNLGTGLVRPHYARFLSHDITSSSRQMSQCSNADGETSNDVKAARKEGTDELEDGRIGSLKRKFSSERTDTIDYPRRRATVAVC